MSDEDRAIAEVNMRWGSVMSGGVRMSTEEADKLFYLLVVLLELYRDECANLDPGEMFEKQNASVENALAVFLAPDADASLLVTHAALAAKQSKEPV